MSAERLTSDYACRDPLLLSDERLTWLTEDRECYGCGDSIVMVRPVGTIVEDHDLICSLCGRGSVH